MKSNEEWARKIIDGTWDGEVTEERMEQGGNCTDKEFDVAAELVAAIRKESREQFAEEIIAQSRSAVDECGFTWVTIEATDLRALAAKSPGQHEK